MFTASRYRRLGSLTAFTVSLTIVFANSLPGLGQTNATESPEQETATDELPPDDQPTAQVEVNPTSLDADIASRLQRILEATDWFENPRVQVTEGVAFLEGRTTSNERKEWAGKLASNTRDVVAVANRIRVIESSIWDFTPAWKELDVMRRNAIQALPTIMLAIVLLILTSFAARGFSLLARRVISRRTNNSLLRDLLTKLLTILVILLGIYLALRVTGLTRLATTVLGGTGLIGLILGIAFRDIAENFLASLLISMQRPFNAGDNIVVEGYTGLVQAVTTRGTTIMTPDGNHVRIPNSIIYKSIIQNLTANPKLRQKFTLSVNETDSLSETQQAILKVLKEHEAILKTPEPLVLVHKFVRPRIILQVYFWIDVRQHAGEKVRSAVIRLVKSALQELSAKKQPSTPPGEPTDGTNVQQTIPDSDHSSSTPAEGALGSDDEQIQQQAREARPVEEGTDLLKNADDKGLPGELVERKAT